MYDYLRHTLNQTHPYICKTIPRKSKSITSTNNAILLDPDHSHSGRAGLAPVRTNYYF